MNKFKLLIILLLFLIGIRAISNNFLYESTSKSVVVLDRNEKILRITLTEDEKYRVWKDLDEINQRFKELIIEKEDKYFYYHIGVNPISFIRSTLRYILGYKTPGASTITMQLARLYYKLETKSILGKLKQVIYAFWLEITLSKNKIFEAYLNLIPMGRNIEGIETASLYYLGKSSTKLDTLELNFFSILPQNPNRIKLKENMSQNIKDLSFQLKSLKGFDVKNFLTNLKLNNKRPFLAPHFVNKVLSKNRGKKILSTSLDLGLQQDTEMILNNYFKVNSDKKLSNATVLLVDNSTGEILIYIGSKDFFDPEIDGQVDGIQAKRSPGSTLKPFIYALAFDQGFLIPKSIVFDSPLPYRTPKNFDGNYKGPMTVEDALITSRNIPAVEINNKLSNPSLFELLNFSGVNINNKASHYGSAIALGALELSSLELASLYAMLGNNGELMTLSPLKNSVKESGTTSVLSREASILVKDILKKNPRPNFKSSEDFAVKKGEVYWKTGTSFGFKDAWSVGIWGKYTLVTWIGDFRSNTNPYYIGGVTAGPLFFNIIDYLRSRKLFKIKDDVIHNFSNQVTNVSVCVVSGKIPNEFCPKIYNSLYIPNKSSLEKCKVHRHIKLSKSNNLRVCPKFQGDTYSKTFEFFTNEKLRLYKKFGFNLNHPPKFERVCKNYLNNSLLGHIPTIISPKIGYTYFTEEISNKAKIPLEANVDIDVDKLNWYIDDELVKVTNTFTKSFIMLSAGEYNLKVIDDKGRTNKRVLRIEDTL